jgi:hypothetical protein
MGIEFVGLTTYVLFHYQTPRGTKVLTMTTFEHMPHTKTINEPGHEVMTKVRIQEILHRTDEFFKQEGQEIGRRAIDVSNVKNLKNEMNRGEWLRVQPDSIVISGKKGILLNGNHRSVAFAESALNEIIFNTLYVDEDVERELSIKADTGKRRSPADAIGIAFGLAKTKAGNAASIIRLAHFAAGSPSSKAIPNHDYVNVFALHKAALIPYLDEWPSDSEMFPIELRFVYTIDFILRHFFHDPAADEIKAILLGRSNAILENDPILMVKNLFDYIRGLKANNSMKAKNKDIKYNDGKAMYTIMEAVKLRRNKRTFHHNRKALTKFPDFDQPPYFDNFNFDTLHREAKP